MQPPSINSAVSALRFFFTVTLDQPDGRQPPALTANELLAHLRLPLAWHERRTVLGLLEPIPALSFIDIAEIPSNRTALPVSRGKQADHLPRPLNHLFSANCRH